MLEVDLDRARDAGLMGFPDILHKYVLLPNVPDSSCSADEMQQRGWGLGVTDPIPFPCMRGYVTNVGPLGFELELWQWLDGPRWHDDFTQESCASIFPSQRHATGRYGQPYPTKIRFFPWCVVEVVKETPPPPMELEPPAESTVTALDGDPIVVPDE